LSEIRVKAIKPLPEPLPEGEKVLWQDSPAWKPFSRRVFQLDKIALYFLVIVAWVATSAYLETREGIALLRSLAWSIPPALGVLGLLAIIAWLYARTTVYTITTRRVVIQSGLALPSAVNLPFRKVSSADMKTFTDETGDIELTMSGPRLLYSMLWPNVRLLRLKRPTPMLRALEQPHMVAEILGGALAADQPGDSVPAQDSEDLESGRRRAATS
jgi:hypothetical protein